MNTIYYGNELYHHGILGQKWGVRRYQNADGSYTPLGKERYTEVDRQEAKAKSAKSGIMKRYHTMNAEQMKAELKVGQQIYSQGLGKRFLNSDKNNDLAKSAYLAGEAKGHERNIENRNSKLGKAYEKQQVFNKKELSKYYANEAKKGNLQRYGDEVIRNTYAMNPELYNIPYQRLSGRMTTRGRNAVENALTLGLAGVIQDAVYLNKQKKNSK